MLKKIKTLFGNNKEIILKYKFTFSLIIINTLLNFFLYEEYDYNEFLSTLILSNLLFFTVETFIDNDKKKIPYLIISILLSAISSNALYNTFNTPRVLLLIIGLYLSIFIMTIYKIIKEKNNFINYFHDLFTNNLLLGVGTIIIQIGLLLITLIIDELLIKEYAIISSFDFLSTKDS